MAKSKAMCRPFENAGEIRAGKKLRPVRKAAWLAGSLASAGPSSVWIGL